MSMTAVERRAFWQAYRADAADETFAHQVATVRSAHEGLREAHARALPAIAHFADKSRAAGRAWDQVAPQVKDELLDRIHAELRSLQQPRSALATFGSNAGRLAVARINRAGAELAAKTGAAPAAFQPRATMVADFDADFQRLAEYVWGAARLRLAELLRDAVAEGDASGLADGLRQVLGVEAAVGEAYRAAAQEGRGLPLAARWRLVAELTARARGADLDALRADKSPAQAAKILADAGRRTGAAADLERLVRREAARAADTLHEAWIASLGARALAEERLDSAACERCARTIGVYPVGSAPRGVRDTHPNCTAIRVPVLRGMGVDADEWRGEPADYKRLFGD
jgi:hypothetical protein